MSVAHTAMVPAKRAVKVPITQTIGSAAGWTSKSGYMRPTR